MAAQDKTGWANYLKSLNGKVKAPDALQVKRGAIPLELYQGYDYLDKSNKLKGIQENNYTLYCVLFNDRFGTYPKDAMERMDHNLRTDYGNALVAFKVQELNSLSFSELLKADLLLLFSKLDRDGYREKYFQKFGKYPIWQ